MKSNFVSGMTFYSGPFWLNLRSLTDLQGAQKKGSKLGQNQLFLVFFISVIEKKLIKARDEVKFCWWLGLSLKATLDEPGKPQEPLGGPKKESKLGQNQLFCSFFPLCNEILVHHSSGMKSNFVSGLAFYLGPF